jgi:hypothetical protein
MELSLTQRSIGDKVSQKLSDAQSEGDRYKREAEALQESVADRDKRNDGLERQVAVLQVMTSVLVVLSSHPLFRSVPLCSFCSFTFIFLSFQPNFIFVTF